MYLLSDMGVNRGPSAQGKNMPSRCPRTGEEDVGMCEGEVTGGWIKLRNEEFQLQCSLTELLMG
jgi:hypothetical protein